MNNIGVWVQFNDGHKEYVGFNRTLNKYDAKFFWKIWSEPKEGQYVRYVTLESKDTVYKKYEFNTIGDIMVRGSNNKLLGCMPIED